jgi:hypothetical protein
MILLLVLKQLIKDLFTKVFKKRSQCITEMDKDRLLFPLRVMLQFNRIFTDISKRHLVELNMVHFSK